MTFWEKLKQYKAEAAEQKIPGSMISPIPYQVLWMLGVPVPPPLHHSFLGKAAMFGIPFGLIMGIFFCVAPMKDDKPLPLLNGIGAGVFGAVAFGLFMATLFMIFSRSYKNAPSWDSEEEE